MHKIINVDVLQNYKVKLTFDDGQQGIADLSHLVGKGVFSSWNDYNTFQNVKIGSSGELMWSDQIDICPDSLYLKITNQKPEDLFPKLKHNELLTTGAGHKVPCGCSTYSGPADPLSRP